MRLQVRAVWRLLRVIACLLRGIVTQSIFFSHWSSAQKQRAVVHWARSMLNAMGVKVQISGSTQSGPLLMVANHYSWLDILVCHSQFFSRFVAKGEIHAWPLLGIMAAKAGTLFIERASRKDALRVVHDMAEALKTGDVLMVFPEGTTNDGLHLLAFHANLLQSAIVAQAPIQPVGLTYWTDAIHSSRSLAPRFFGDDTLLGSVWATLCASEVVAHVCVGESQYADGRDRREWASDLQKIVAALSGS